MRELRQATVAAGWLNEEVRVAAEGHDPAPSRMLSPSKSTTGSLNHSHIPASADKC